MTRENKLALIIGFGLFLVVGILVSDHFSSASQRETADLATSGSGAERSPRLDNPALLQQLEGPGDRAIPIAGNGTLGPSLSDRARERSGESTTPRITLNDHPGEIWTPDISGGPSAPPTKPSGYAWYVIKSGETLSGICKREYGDENLWQRLADANQDRISNPEIVPSGVTIRLPDSRKSLLALASGSPVEEVDSQPKAVPSTGSGSAGPRFELYEVQDGESLSKIASRFLGTGTKWKVLYELNRDVISNPDNVAAGTRIKVPVTR